MADQTLAQRIKAKYPGEYDDIPDAELERRIKAKYPGEYDDLPTTPTSSSSAPTTPKPTAMDAARTYIPQIDLLIGAIKGAGQTAVGLGELAHKIPGVSALTDYLYGMPSGSSQQSFDVARDDLKPSNTAQAIGKTAEQTAEFFVPGGVVNRGVQAAKTLPRVAQVAARMGLEGASAAGVHAAQTGSLAGAPTVGSVAAATAGLSEAASPALKWLGDRVESALVKATKADVENGFKANNIFKHGLGGTLEQTMAKSQEKLDDLSLALQAELRRPGSGGKAPRVDVFGAIDEARKELTTRADKNFGELGAIRRAIESFYGELDDQAIRTLAPGGITDLVTANRIKQAIGEKGAWQYGKMDPDARATEMVASTIYRKLKESIERAATSSAKVKELNRAMAEIIPIRQAILRRIPVEQRQNVVNLGDMIGFGTGAWWISMLNRVMRSGQTANLANRASQAIPQTSVPSAITGAVTSGSIR